LLGRYVEHGLRGFIRRRALPGSRDVNGVFVYDEDVADAFVLAFDQRAAGAFNVTAQDALPLSELCAAAGWSYRGAPLPLVKVARRLIARAHRVGLLRHVDVAWLDMGDINLEFDNARARDELGWRPRAETVTDVLGLCAREVPGEASSELRSWIDSLSGVTTSAPDNELHLRVDGPDGGDFALLSERGRVTASVGVPRPPTCVARLRLDTLRELRAGRVDVGAALADGALRWSGDERGVALLAQACRSGA
jgi:hypothetical protein